MNWVKRIIRRRESTDWFHKFRGKKRTRVVYKNTDFVDYVIMTFICFVIAASSFGWNHVFTHLSLVLSIIMIGNFMLRHGATLVVPLIFRRPKDFIQSLYYKFENLSLPMLAGISFICLENAIIHLTPTWPHYSSWMKEAAFILLYLHFALSSLFRTIVFAAHLRKQDHVASVLSESSWKSFIGTRTKLRIELVHAYTTGLYTHVVYLAPWYIIIENLNYSLVLSPFAIVINLLTEKYFLKGLNRWFYRDHWLGHHSEFDFVYLHGTHHDAIPSAMIGVGGNGHLEGFLRQLLGFPVTFYNPLTAFLVQTMGSYGNMVNHQYIPGVFPGARRDIEMQHSIHHYMRLEPFSVGGFYGGKGLDVFPDEIKYSLELDLELNDYKRDNRHYRWYLNLIERYQRP